MPKIFHAVLIAATAEKIYNAITTEKGLSGWWCPDTKAKPELGSIARFTFDPAYYKEMRITELAPFKRVKWLCLTASEEWIGTSITFELESIDKGTRLTFHHDDWKDYTQEFAACNYNWALFLRSLKLLCETGKGLPNPHHY